MTESKAESKASLPWKLIEKIVEECVVSTYYEEIERLYVKSAKTRERGITDLSQYPNWTFERYDVYSGEEHRTERHHLQLRAVPAVEGGVCYQIRIIDVSSNLHQYKAASTFARQINKLTEVSSAFHKEVAKHVDTQAQIAETRYYNSPYPIKIRKGLGFNISELGPVMDLIDSFRIKKIMAGELQRVNDWVWWLPRPYVDHDGKYLLDEWKQEDEMIRLIGNMERFSVRRRL